ncbi:MAG: 4Fe-4S binding protein [Chloroflexi bacterium]|nr:4Fe-4S binding protein [Chloroflexota bacterium]
MKEYKAPRLDRPWTEVNPGGIVLEPGVSVTYVTGTWRTMQPVRDHAQCTQCLICWIMCPDGAIPIVDGKVSGFDLVHCKGCGICAAECPVNIKKPHSETGEMGKAIQMVPEPAESDA